MNHQVINDANSKVLVFSSNVENAKSLQFFFKKNNIVSKIVHTKEESIEFINLEKPNIICFDLTTDLDDDINAAIKIQHLLYEHDDCLPILVLIKFSQLETVITAETSTQRTILERVLKTFPYHVVGKDYFDWSDEDWKIFYYRICGIYSTIEYYTNIQEAYRDLQRSYRTMRREMTEVWNIQRSFLSRYIYDNSVFSVATSYKPSTQVGGDYFDIVEIDDEHVAFIMADIAGHGASAAVIMAITQMTVKEFGKGITEPGYALDVFNSKLNEHLSSHHFVTMFYALLNLNTRRLKFTSAGHNPPLLFVHSEEDVILLESEPGFPLRTFDNLSYDEQQVQLHSGDRLLLFTDGVTDIQNDKNELFGVDNLKRILYQNRQKNIDEIVETINHETDVFLNHRERLDDFTLMLIEIS